MRFWPFGKDKSAENQALDFGSRVVTGSAGDGRQVRAKLTAAFTNPLPQPEADKIMDEASIELRLAFERASAANDLIGSEAELAQSLSQKFTQARSIEVVALHIPGESSELARRPFSELPASQGEVARSHTPGGTRRASSSQLFAVRDSRLIPEAASPEACAAAIVPLMRDASTRVLVGILRAYDLLVLRAVDVSSTSEDDLGELVPLSQAPPGHFAEERRSELARWAEELGTPKLLELRQESSAIVCLFLHLSLERAGVPTQQAITLLEAAAQLAFPAEGAVARMPSYLGLADPAEALASRAMTALNANRDVLAGFARAIAPIVTSLQEDFSFTATQIKLSGMNEATV